MDSIDLGSPKALEARAILARLHRGEIDAEKCNMLIEPLGLSDAEVDAIEDKLIAEAQR